MHTTWHLHSVPVCFRLSSACILEFAFVNLERFMNSDARYTDSRSRQTPEDPPARPEGVPVR